MVVMVMVGWDCCRHVLHDYDDIYFNAFTSDPFWFLRRYCSCIIIYIRESYVLETWKQCKVASTLYITRGRSEGVGLTAGEMLVGVGDLWANLG